tara:strand:+ start:1746 stop:2261 length:516 start_codon:yes stop_codon:yes gene_type:complete
MISSKNSLLQDSLLAYYDNKMNMTTFVEILHEKSLVSLRMIDWFVTKYAKNHKIQYNVNGKPFSVFHNYKAQLKAYSKKQIDPFCRRERIILSKHGHEIITTLGQMNFFRWAIENHILKYIYENYDVLEKHMKEDSRNRILTKKKKKKKDTVVDTKKTFTKTNHPTIISFD